MLLDHILDFFFFFNVGWDLCLGFVTLTPALAHTFRTKETIPCSVSRLYRLCSGSNPKFVNYQEKGLNPKRSIDATPETISGPGGNFLVSILLPPLKIFFKNFFHEIWISNNFLMLNLAFGGCCCLKLTV